MFSVQSYCVRNSSWLVCHMLVHHAWSSGHLTSHFLHCLLCHPLRSARTVSSVHLISGYNPVEFVSCCLRELGLAFVLLSVYITSWLPQSKFIFYFDPLLLQRRSWLLGNGRRLRNTLSSFGIVIVQNQVASFACPAILTDSSINQNT